MLWRPWCLFVAAVVAAVVAVVVVVAAAAVVAAEAAVAARLLSLLLLLSLTFALPLLLRVLLAPNAFFQHLVRQRLPPLVRRRRDPSAIVSLRETHYSAPSATAAQP